MSAEPYRTICISIYDVDLERLDAKVMELRRRGHTVTRSQLIRYAAHMFDVDRVDENDPMATPNRVGQYR